MKDKKSVKNLDLEVRLAQAEKFDNSMKKNLTNGFKKILILAGIPSLSLISFIFLNPTLAFVITVILSGCTVGGYFISDFKKIIKGTHLDKNSKKIIQFKREEVNDAEEILDNDIEKYYTPKYASILAEQSKSEPMDQSGLEYENTEDNLEVLTKNETQDRLAQEINMYYSAYNMPSWEVLEEDWDFFIDYLYNVLCEKHLEKNFYVMMNTLVRAALSRSLVNKKSSISSISIVDFISSLDCFECENISKKEILKFQKDLLAGRSPVNNIIKMEQYPNK